MSRLRKNRLEWSVFACGCAVTGALVVCLVLDALTCGHEPPLLTVELGRPIARGAAHVLPVIVHNRGDVTANAVHIEVRLTTGDGDERAELALETVARGAHRRGWVSFRHPPTADALSARVLGYEEP